MNNIMFAALLPPYH